MRLLNLCVCVLLILSSALLRADDPATQPTDGATTPRVGKFMTTFTERSPLTESKALAKRLAEKEVKGEYDLAKQQFVVHVPENYTPSEAVGLVVLLNYKETNEPPITCLEILRDKKLIFVSPKVLPEYPMIRCAMALDAVHNLKQQYNIDDRRIFLMSFDKRDGGPRLIFAAPDVFAGGFIRNFGYIKDVHVREKQTYYPAAFPTPPAINKAKTHPLLIGNEQADVARLMIEQLKKDGFKRVDEIQCSPQVAHYPDYKPEWFTQVIEFLGAAPDDVATTAPAADSEPVPAAAAGQEQKQPPATQRPPAAQPASEAKQMLMMARNYVAARKYPEARKRLEDLIAKHPSSPEAVEAKKLLKEIEGK